jgi:hypothetical protein
MRIINYVQPDITRRVRPHGKANAPDKRGGATVRSGLQRGPSGREKWPDSHNQNRESHSGPEGGHAAALSGPRTPGICCGCGSGITRSGNGKWLKQPHPGGCSPLGASLQCGSNRTTPLAGTPERRWREAYYGSARECNSPKHRHIALSPLRSDRAAWPHPRQRAACPPRQLPQLWGIHPMGVPLYARRTRSKTGCRARCREGQAAADRAATEFLIQPRTQPGARQ